jgi:hypothetical protein
MKIDSIICEKIEYFDNNFRENGILILGDRWEEVTVKIRGLNLSEFLTKESMNEILELLKKGIEK